MATIQENSGKTPAIGIRGTDFTLNEKAFFFQGLSFFNALYNSNFLEDEKNTKKWLRKFRYYGITVLRLWAQWDCLDEKFVDSGPEQSLYRQNGSLRFDIVKNLTALLEYAGKLGMVVELTAFSPGCKTHFSLPLQDKALISLSHALCPHRNLVLQVWNENSEAVFRHFRTIKTIDPARLVTNSPGPAGDLGDHQGNLLLDFLTPHTSRDPLAFWKVAPLEIQRLIARYHKPVVDDEPARTGIARHGGIPDSKPDQHICQIQAVRKIGGHHIYHHDMFQSGYGKPATPPSGIPDPQFSGFHQKVFRFLRKQNPNIL